jgi:hypothetical protein
MKLIDEKKAINDLRKAFKSHNLSIYLGAGVSVSSGLPSWDQLVLLMYFRTLKADMPFSVYSNYLLAMADWLLKKKNDPLDVVIRKIKKSGWDNNQFLEVLWQTLYSGFMVGNQIQSPRVLTGNPTLAAIIHELCAKSNPAKIGLRSIITYNYDNLLELGLKQKKIGKSFNVIFKNSQSLFPNTIPIYHVHGYMPLEGIVANEANNEIIFSEEQYNNMYQDSYFWGNMVQMQSLSSYTGLLIGISMTDRNIRRILDAIKKTPIPTKNYWLVRRSTIQTPTEGSEEMEAIRRVARENKNKLQRSGLKKPADEFLKITGTISEILRFEEETFNAVYKSMGLEVLLYEDYNEVPAFIKKITAS